MQRKRPIIQENITEVPKALGLGLYRLLGLLGFLDSEFRVLGSAFCIKRLSTTKAIRFSKKCNSNASKAAAHYYYASSSCCCYLSCNCYCHCYYCCDDDGYDNDSE